MHSEEKPYAERCRALFFLMAWNHRLLHIDPIALQGECSSCGTVKLKRRYPRGRDERPRYSCYEADRQWTKAQPKKYRPRRRAAISEPEAQAIIRSQGGRCWICGDTKRIVIDHCHDTQVVRGALCHHCNVGLGGFRDNPEWLARAIEYLRR